MSTGGRKALLVSVLVLLLASGAVYGYFFLLPARQCAAVLADFEHAGRTGDAVRLEQLVSKDAPLYGQWRALREELEKFEPGIGVARARYAPGTPVSDHWMITGVAKLRAKVDGEYRFLLDVELVQEDGAWRIRQFLFPDYMDY